MNEGLLRALVVDDTVVYRRILTEVIESIPEAALMGTAAHGRLALAKMAQSPVDLVLLDVEMPVMDGIETLDAIRRDYPDVGVIMVSGVNRNAADITLRALERGALDFIPKPEGSDRQANREELTSQLRPLVQLFSTRRRLRLAREAGAAAPPRRGKKKSADVVRARAAPEVDRAPAPKVRRAAPRPSRIDVLAIGVSTGGPNALTKLIPALPKDLGVPVLIVQHMPPVFTKSLADSLGRKAQIPVLEARDGERIRPNVALIAPGGSHMVVRRKAGANGRAPQFCISLNENPPENSCRPSVDVLFRSVSAQYGGHVLAAIMTGMGNDGCEGVRAMKRKGAYCVTQSEESCVVYGMPLAVDEAGLSDESVGLDGLATRLAALVRNPGTA